MKGSIIFEVDGSDTDMHIKVVPSLHEVNEVDKLYLVQSLCDVLELSPYHLAVLIMMQDEIKEGQSIMRINLNALKSIKDERESEDEEEDECDDEVYE